MLEHINGGPLIVHTLWLPIHDSPLISVRISNYVNPGKIHRNIGHCASAIHAIRMRLRVNEAFSPEGGKITAHVAENFTSHLKAHVFYTHASN